MGAAPGGPSHADELVRLIKSSGDFCVGVAAFPEGHPRSPDPETDLGHFVAKCRAGADFAITQMFFYAEDYLRLRDQAAAAGCDVPIIAGIMPVTSLRVVERALELGGCRIPGDLLDDLRAADAAGDKAGLREIGVGYAAVLCEELLAEGAPGLHFYTLNFSRATREIYQLLGLAGGYIPAPRTQPHLPRKPPDPHVSAPGTQVTAASRRLPAASVHVMIMGRKHRCSRLPPVPLTSQEHRSPSCFPVIAEVPPGPGIRGPDRHRRWWLCRETRHDQQQGRRRPDAVPKWPRPMWLS